MKPQFVATAKGGAFNKSSLPRMKRMAALMRQRELSNDDVLRQWQRQEARKALQQSKEDTIITQLKAGALFR